MLAAKAALAIRYDALGEDTSAEMGVENRAKLEARLRQLEDKGVSTAENPSRSSTGSSTHAHPVSSFSSDPENQWNRQSDGKGRQVPAQEVSLAFISSTDVLMYTWEVLTSSTSFLRSEVRVYDPSGDSTIPSTSKKRKFEEVEEEEPAAPAAKAKKVKKEAVKEEEAETLAAAEEVPKKKKKKKKDKKAEEEVKEEEEEVALSESPEVR